MRYFGMSFLKIKYSSRLLLASVLSGILLLAIACGSDTAPAPAPAPYVAPTAVPAIAPTAVPVATSKPKTVPSTSGPQKGGILRFAARPLAELKTFDGHYRSMFGEYHTNYLLYDNLVRLDANGNINPGLASSWNISADGKSVDFSLVKGAKFQDGSDFNAQAVKYNMDRLMDPEVQSPGRAGVSAISSVTVVDDDTVRFNLSNPFRPLLAQLTLQAGWISSPTAVEKYNAYSNRNSDYGKNPAGTGPFLLTTWEPGQRVTFERNPNYWGEGLPYLDGVDFIGAANEVKMAMIRTDEADLMELSPWAMRELKKVEGNPNVKVILLPSGRHHYVEVDSNWGALADKKVRQAMGWGIDRETAVDIVFDGKGTPAYGPENIGWWAYDIDEMKKIMDYDPSKAKELLAEAGHANGLTLPMWCRGDGEAEKSFCEIWQAMMREIGITLELKMLPYAEIKVARAEGLVHMESFWFTPRGDIHGRFAAQYHSTGWGNFHKYKNLEVDALLDEASTIFDVAKAGNMYRDIQKIVVSDAPRLFTAHPDAAVVTTSRVQGFEYASDMILRMQDIWVNK